MIYEEQVFEVGKVTGNGGKMVAGQTIVGDNRIIAKNKHSWDLWVCQNI